MQPNLREHENNDWGMVEQKLFDRQKNRIKGGMRWIYINRILNSARGMARGCLWGNEAQPMNMFKKSMFSLILCFPSAVPKHWQYSGLLLLLFSTEGWLKMKPTKLRDGNDTGWRGAFCPAAQVEHLTARRILGKMQKYCKSLIINHENTKWKIKNTEKLCRWKHSHFMCLKQNYLITFVLLLSQGLGQLSTWNLREPGTTTTVTAYGVPVFVCRWRGPKGSWHPTPVQRKYTNTKIIKDFLMHTPIIQLLVFKEFG